jgi:putative transposase
MKGERIRYQQTGEFHFLTFSSFRRQPYLSTVAAMELFEDALERVRLRYLFAVAGYVVMPEHVHLLVNEPGRGLLSRTVQALKLSVSMRSRERPFWQAHYYDFNVSSHQKFVEKLRYIHRNPVRRGLVAKPEEWLWSSYRHYQTACAEPWKSNRNGRPAREAGNCLSGCATGISIPLPRSPKARDRGHPQLDHARYETRATCQAQQAAQNAQQAAQQTSGRQSDGSYIADPSKVDPIVNLANPLPGPLGGCEQCVCATSYFSGVTEDTSQWTKGDPVVIDGKVNPNIKNNTAIATFDENGRYFPISDHKNSGIFRGASSGNAPGTFTILDQWPTVKDQNGNVVRPFSPAQERPVRPTGTWPSDNSNAYYVITVPR